MLNKNSRYCWNPRDAHEGTEFQWRWKESRCVAAVYECCIERLFVQAASTVRIILMETSRGRKFNTNQEKGRAAGTEGWFKLIREVGDWAVDVSGLRQISDWLLLLDWVKEGETHSVTVGPMWASGRCANWWMCISLLKWLSIWGKGLRDRKWTSSGAPFNRMQGSNMLLGLNWWNCVSQSVR